MSAERGVVMQTRITSLLGCKYPIVQGGLHRLGRAEFAVAVSRSGAFGLITASCYDTPRGFAEAIGWALKTSDAPFGVNITFGIRRPMTEYVEVMTHFPKVAVFTAGANPQSYAALIKSGDRPWVHVVTSVRHAQKAQSLGADAVVAVGFEAGGHPGRDDVGGLALIPRVVDSVDIPVIAAGGIADGRGILAALSLGAEGVQMGTRFVATLECPAPASLHEAFLRASEVDTMIIKRSIGKPSRVMRTDTARLVRDMEDRGEPMERWFSYIRGESYDDVLRTGDLQAGVVSAGQGLGLVDRVSSVDETVHTLVNQVESAYVRLARILNSGAKSKQRD